MLDLKEIVQSDGNVYVVSRRVAINITINTISFRFPKSVSYKELPKRLN